MNPEPISINKDWQCKNAEPVVSDIKWQKSTIKCKYSNAYISDSDYCSDCPARDTDL